jgi:hypothetical protein
MFNFTHNNHLKYTIKDKLYGIRETPYEKFLVTCGQIDHDHYKKSSWLNEQYRTADLVYNDFGSDIIIMFSGGTDSEIVLRSFKHIGITPRSVFIKFKNDYNINDFKIADQIARELDVKLEVIEFDVKEFYNSGEAYEFSKTIQCRQIAYLTVYHNILKLQAPAVMGGEMLLRRHVDTIGSKWYYCFRENEDASAMRFSMTYNIPLVNEWFSYTPEMMGYYLEDPKIHWLMTDKYNFKLASVSTKNEILHRLFPNITNKVKTHGYEKLMGFNGETYNELYLSHVRRIEPSLDGIFIDDLKHQLYGEDYVSSKA